MQKILILFTVLNFSLPLLAENDYWTANGWEKVEEKEGISSFRKEIPGTGKKGVGGEAMIDAPIEKVVGALLDCEHGKEWIDSQKESYIVKQLSPMSFIQYTRFDLTYPVDDREFIYRNDISVSNKKREIYIKIKSIPYPAIKTEADVVRGEIIAGSYLFRQVGNSTLMRAEYLADPKGDVPVLLVNFAQKNWPYNTFNNLRQQVKKPYVKEKILLKPSKKKKQ